MSASHVITTAMLVVAITISLAAVTADKHDANNQTILLVSRERALSVLNTVNDTILFVDMQIALAEQERKNVVDAVAHLSSARLTLKEARLAIDVDGGDYVKAVELASLASTKAQHALVFVPKPTQQLASGMTFQQAESMLKSANGTILFVDEKIAEAERSRKNVIKPVERLAEARGLFRQASVAFKEGSYQPSYELASRAMTTAQDSLAVLSQAPPATTTPPAFINPRNLAIMAGALLLIALVVYFKIRKPHPAVRQYYPRPYYYYPYRPPPPPPQFYQSAWKPLAQQPGQQYRYGYYQPAMPAAGARPQERAKKAGPGQGQGR